MTDVIFSSGTDRIGGALALPPDAGPHAGLVLVPDVRGLYDHFREVAARFAREGFATLALDLYSREGMPDLPDMEAVFRWMRRLPDRRVLRDIQASVDFLASRDDVARTAIGVTGFCMGGQYALMAACSVGGLAACVGWYGMLRYIQTDELKPESPLDMAPRLACPYLGLFGQEDAIVPLADVEELERVLASCGKDFSIVTYPGAGHAFFNDTRPEMYRPEAARDAWDKAIAFLRERLGGRL